MRYLFYYFHEQYTYREKVPTRNLPLEDLFEFLRDKQMRWIKLSEDENDPRKVIIWSRLNIKKARSHKDFSTHEEYLAYLEQYSKYSRKRFKEIPCVKTFKDNLEFLEHQWTEIYARKPNFLIFRQHDNGFVDILEKNELSAGDIAIMDREHKIYLNYVRRWNAYLVAHPNRNGVWYSSADDEYESDFALYDPIDEQGVDE